MIKGDIFASYKYIFKGGKKKKKIRKDKRNWSHEFPSPRLYRALKSLFTVNPPSLGEIWQIFEGKKVEMHEEL
jgi:hypothetical protein